MKRKVIGYIKDDKIVEVIASVDCLYLEQFNEAINGHHFILKRKERYDDRETIDNSEANILKTDSEKYAKIIESSKMLVEEIKNVSNQSVIDFSNIYKIISENNCLDNEDTKEILTTFLDIYDFSNAVEYNIDEYNSIKGKINNLGTRREKEDIEKFEISLLGNTSIFNFLGYKGFTHVSIDKKIIYSKIKV